MEPTSKQWKENQQNQLTSEGFVEILYGVNHPDIPMANVFAHQEHQALYISSMPESFNPPLIDEVERKVVPYATLEQNLWLLDGSKFTVPVNGPYEYSGYISESLSDEIGNFSSNPRISIKFVSKVSILPGLIITWSLAHGDYPTHFKVRPYNGDIVYECLEVKNNTKTISVVEFEMTDFSRLEIEIIKWSTPSRRARIEKIVLGIFQSYTKQDLLKFTCSQTVDPLSASLPKYEVSFEVDNRDGTFDLQNEEGLSKYMMERQQISTRYGFRLGDTIEWIPGGVYYLSDWSAPQNGLSASFKARDLLGFMNAIYYKGRYEPGGVSLYELAQEVLEEAKLPKYKTGIDPWVLDREALGSITTTAPLPVCSLGECLQIIANAACCAISFDRNGILYIAPLANTNDELIINDRNSYSKTEISLTKPLKQIDVSMYSFTIEGTEKSIYNGTLALNQGKNVFVVEYSDTALANIAGVQVHGVGVTLNKNETEYYAKSCKLVLNSTNSGISNCNVSITGTVIKPTETIVTIPNLAAGETQTLKNALITSVSHANKVGNWLKRNLSSRKCLSSNWRINPCLDAGDIIKVGTPETSVRVVSCELSFSGAFKGKSEGVEIK